MGKPESREKVDERTEDRHFKIVVYFFGWQLGCPKKNKSPNFGTQLTPVVFVG